MAIEPTNKSAEPSSAAKPLEPQTATVRYVDRPECAETFADSINNVYFDGQSLRIEFGITEHGREPADARECLAVVAASSRASAGSRPCSVMPNSIRSDWPSK